MIDDHKANKTGEKIIVSNRLLSPSHRITFPFATVCQSKSATHLDLSA